MTAFHKKDVTSHNQSSMKAKKPIQNRVSDAATFSSVLSWLQISSIVSDGKLPFWSFLRLKLFSELTYEQK